MANKCIPILLLLLLTACTTGSLEPLAKPGPSPYITWPQAPNTARIEFVEIFSGPDDLGYRESFARKMQTLLVGRDDKRMTRPYALAVNSHSMVIADPGSALVHVFDKKRKSYRFLSKAGKHDFVSPISVIFGNDRLYIADSELNKVFVFSARFKFLSTIDGFKRPTGLAYDTKRERLYVADTLAHEIRIFDRDGNFLDKIGERGEHDAQFNYPSHLTFINDQLFVNDTMNFRIQIFDQYGQHLSSFGEQGDGDGFLNKPKGIAVDSDGHVYIAGALANNVQIFDQSGQFLLRFGHGGDGPGAFQMPAGLAIWNDTIYVADSHNHRVQVFRYLQEDQ